MRRLEERHQRERQADKAERAQQHRELLMALTQSREREVCPSDADRTDSGLVSESEMRTAQEIGGNAVVKPQRLKKMPWMPSRVRLIRRPAKSTSSSGNESDPAWDPGARRPSRYRRASSRKKERGKPAPYLSYSYPPVSCRSNSDTPWEPGIRMPERLQRAPSRNLGALSSSESLRGG